MVQWEECLLGLLHIRYKGRSRRLHEKWSVQGTDRATIHQPAICHCVWDPSRYWDRCRPRLLVWKVSRDQLLCRPCRSVPMHVALTLAISSSGGVAKTWLVVVFNIIIKLPYPILSYPCQCESCRYARDKRFSPATVSSFGNISNPWSKSLPWSKSIMTHRRRRPLDFSVDQIRGCGKRTLWLQYATVLTSHDNRSWDAFLVVTPEHKA